MRGSERWSRRERMAGCWCWMMSWLAACTMQTGGIGAGEATINEDPASDDQRDASMLVLCGAGLALVGDECVLVDPQVADAQVPDPQVADAQVPDPQVADAQVPDPQVADARVLDAQVPDARLPDAQAPDAQAPCTAGSVGCNVCPSGYLRSKGAGCVDVDECALNRGGCDPRVTCTNLPGGFQCGSCPTGYSGDGSRSCADIDECASNEARCDAHTPCINLVGSYRCGDCPSGYTGSGSTGCVDIDECKTAHGDCSPHASCANTPGGHTVLPGYAGNGVSCADVDECVLDNGGCHDDADCTNLPGSRSCACAPDSVGDEPPQQIGPAARERSGRIGQRLPHRSERRDRVLGPRGAGAQYAATRDDDRARSGATERMCLARGRQRGLLGRRPGRQCHRSGRHLHAACGRPERQLRPARRRLDRLLGVQPGGHLRTTARSLHTHRGWQPTRVRCVADQTAVCWGANDAGQSDVPAGVSLQGDRGGREL